MIYNAAIYPSGFFVSRVNARFRAGAALGRRPYPYKRNPSCLIEVPSILMDCPQPVNSARAVEEKGLRRRAAHPRWLPLGGPHQAAPHLAVARTGMPADDS